MPDYFGTYANVNVWEYLDFFARAYGMRGEQRRRAIAYTMDFTGLDRLARKPIDGLSKGMKQRLCLGRTMIHDPSVMVLDEPAAGLDPRARIELREMISRLADLGKAVLISSHILTELAEVCDRVGIIESGKLIAVGSVDEISRRVGEVVRVRLRLAGDDASRVEAVQHWLAPRDNVEDVSLTKEGVVFAMVAEHEQIDAALAGLLAALIADGFPVVEFTSRGKSLEDVFLHSYGGSYRLGQSAPARRSDRNSYPAPFG